MWKCLCCKEMIDNEFDACWQCGVERGKAEGGRVSTPIAEPLLPNGLLQSQSLAAGKTGSHEADIVRMLTRRYADAYRSARWLVRLGGLIKLAAIGLAVFVIAFSLVLSSSFSFAIPAGVAVGSVVCVPTYVLGVLSSGQGQTNLATLDTAVNTSRHLTNDDVAALLFG